MTIAKDFASKLAVAFVAVAMAFSAFASTASAQSTEDLQAMINDLLAQVSGLQAELGQDEGDSMTSSSSVCPYTWTRDLSTGSEGSDVMKLQQFLNSDADTRVSVEGAGSAGMETDYYGPATAAAVSKMQVKYRSLVLSPANLVNPTGYFGPSSRSAANSLCVEAPAMDDDSDDSDESDDSSDDSDDNESTSLSGEGTLATLEVDDEEDEVMEGSEDTVVASLTLEAEDGDVELSRVTMTLVDAGGDTNDENEPWDVFEEVSLWVDGDKVASFDASDEDEYLEEDEGEFRLSGLDLFLPEDDEVEVLVAVSVMNSVDGAATPGDTSADWTITPTSVRVFDADGVADTILSPSLELGDGETFDIVEEGYDDGADLESSSDNPDASTLLVDEDTDESDEFTTHIFEIEVDDESSDLVLEDVWYAVTVDNNGSDITGGQRDVINEITMTVDGTTVEGDAILSADTNGGPDEDDEAIDAAAGGTTTVHYIFEFDGDVELEADETYDVEISMVFEGQDGNYINGVTVEGVAPGAIWELEGLEDDNVLTGSDSSETHTLASVVPVISGTDFSVDRNEAGDAGTISFEFNVEADGENDVTLTFADVANVQGASDDTRFEISGGDLGANATASIAKISGDATANGSTGWTIADGDDATFVLDVVFDAASAAGAYRVFMDTINGVEIDETSSPLNI